MERNKAAAFELYKPLPIENDPRFKSLFKEYKRK